MPLKKPNTEGNSSINAKDRKETLDKVLPFDASDSKLDKLSKSAKYTNENVLLSKGFKIVKNLGKGAFGSVVLLEDFNSEPSRLLACKIIDSRKASPDYNLKFIPRELEILSKIEHPHIIFVHYIFSSQDKIFIVMRYAENGDLLDYVLESGPLSEDHTKFWYKQLLSAVQYLHFLNIAHRDIKCENIFISSKYNLKLGDFDFARYSVDEKGERELSTTFCGSISYAAPEILKAKPYAPKNVDMWALGVVLFVLLNKGFPFYENGNAKLLLNQQVGKFCF